MYETEKNARFGEQRNSRDAVLDFGRILIDCYCIIIFYRNEYNIYLNLYSSLVLFSKALFGTIAIKILINDLHKLSLLLFEILSVLNLTFLRKYMSHKDIHKYLLFKK